MISSVFGKRKPVNYIIVFAFVFVLYWFVNLYMLNRSFGPNQLLFQTFVLGILLFSIFVVNFIVKRIKVTSSNSFGILFYTMLFLIFPNVLADNDAIFCSLFLLFASRRLLSLRSQKNVKLKIFDATLWVVVASFFYDWALLFIILVYVSIAFYGSKNIRNWLVPVAGGFTGFIILIAILVLSNNTGFFSDHYIFDFTLNTSFFSGLGNSTKYVAYFLIITLIGIITFVKLGITGLGRVTTLRLLAVSFVLGMVLVVLKSTSLVTPVIVTFFPSVIFINSYIESIRKDKVREIVIILCVLIPFVVFAANLSMS
ncbi:hypothetical protein K8352_09350 [Flavobacteriaceae bacterium F89]|uniref:Uncharacterized protein n=1 Tax=Cerina litoralis TaxID=2874477 RepID=A0AAE3EVB1_9FLAO|nr:hypothetical protein [Cerina litoralis]MCG2460953.1 hypothetical protein [Cerina litoralis]